MGISACQLVSVALWGFPQVMGVTILGFNAKSCSSMTWMIWWGYPQIIQVMNEHDLVLKPKVEI
jgi:hypothetical protein